MTQLDERTRRALLAADDPPRGMQDRIYRAIVVGGGPPAGGEGEPSGGGGGLDLPLPSGGGFELAFAAKVVGATIGLTSSGLVVLALAGAGIRAIDRPEPARERAVEAREPAEPSAASTSEPPRPPTQDSATTIVAVEPTFADEPEATTMTRASSTEAAPSGSSLEAELALIEAARAATDLADILAALERHRDEFPSGVLADEREVMRIEALCGLGRIADAERVAAAFVAAKPSHPLRSRVEPACPK